MNSTNSRNLALDRTRTFLTLVVVLHHAVIPYTYYGHTDPAYWIGFDLIALANDSFFMAMFFFLSGLFVWPGLKRKSPRHYLRERLLRLGLPFAIGALTLIPFAYYAPTLRQTPGLTFAEFWLKTVSQGPWPSGPIWFLWVLLIFDLLASLIFVASSPFVKGIDRLARIGFTSPARFWWILFAVSWIAYIPLVFCFGGSRWFEFGPFSVQASRVLLYFSYFLIGVGVGSAGFAGSVLSAEGQLPKRRRSWLTVTVLFYGLMWGMIWIKRSLLENPPGLPWWYHLAYGTLFVGFSAAILLAICAFFLHVKTGRASVLDRFQGEAYGIFLVHYSILLWIQYFLYNAAWTAGAKAIVGFVSTVMLSWMVTAGLRQLPWVRRVL